MVRLLGEGGFGVVHLATHRTLDRQVALKLLKGDALEDREMLARFAAEARVTAALAHPHIVVILDHDMEDERPWIAYEFLPGRSVKELLAAGGLVLREALEVGRQVATALAHAHAHGVLHRDIKPANVLEASAGHYKVCDFGIARWVEGTQLHTKTGRIIGTPTYIAPEQALGEPAGPRSDVYALGVMLFEMVCRRPPFIEENPLALLLLHRDARPPRPSSLRAGLPSTVEQLILRCLAKAPADRFRSAAELAEVLEREVAKAPSGAAETVAGTMAALPRPSGAPTRKPTRPSGKLAAVAVAPAAPRPPRAALLGAMLAIGLGLFALVPGRRPEVPPRPQSSSPPQAPTPGFARPLDESWILARQGELEELHVRSHARGQQAARATGHTRDGSAHDTGGGWRELAAAERQDRAVLDRIRQSLLDRSGAPATAPIRLLVARARALALDYILSSRVEIYPKLAELDSTDRHGGETDLFDKLDKANSALTIPQDESVARSVEIYLRSLSTLLPRAAAAPGDLGGEYGVLLEDVCDVSENLGVFNVWKGAGKPRVERAWQDCRTALDELSPPAGRQLRELVVAAWTMGQAPGTFRKTIVVDRTIAAADVLVDLVPAAAAGLAPFKARLRPRSGAVTRVP